MERQARANERAARQDYLEARAGEVEDLNSELEEQNFELNSLLTASLGRSAAIDFSQLRREADLTQIERRLQALYAPVKSAFDPKPLGFFEKLFPGAPERLAKAKAEGERRHQAAADEYSALSEQRTKAIEALVAAADAHNEEIDEFQTAFFSREPEAIKAYYEIVLANSDYPDSFPNSIRVGFVPESRQLVVEFQLPTLDEAVPTVEKYTFIKTADEIREKSRTDKSRKAQYIDVISQIVLRSVYEVFSADASAPVDVVAINGFVVATDPSTGREVQPCIVSLRVGRETFSTLELRSVEASACLKRLNASVSRSPAELAAVKPVVDINMADPRFVDEQDVLAMLDTRPNLMDLTPGEFESLITNLFQSMGLETKLTQASRDGGVDCVAFDPRPVLGGKVIVQAKRYKNTVGVSAVRDLFGTVHNEGASKGILVTTSGYGKAAFAFAEGKPIELLSGSNLLYLLKEQAGVDAKIEIPEDWVDPVLDVSS
ncbi:MAG: restriction endonuclease [Caulobacter sp.]|nr:restriction endonuclease [Caulobacter sp.]